jgi:hypothetical protein
LPQTIRFDTSTFLNGVLNVAFNAISGKANSSSVRIFIVGDPSKSSTIAVSSSGLVYAPQPRTNLALGKTATQNTTILGAVASRANDGNTDGDFYHNSVSHTDISDHPWWEVDLGQSQVISEIRVWNRTDGATSTKDRLSNYYVILSNTPRTGNWLIDLVGAVTSSYQTATAGSPTVIPFSGSGRYVRVMINSTQYLHMAEVEVFGY